LWLFHVWSWRLLGIVKTNVGQIFDFLRITGPYKCSPKTNENYNYIPKQVFQFLIYCGLSISTQLPYQLINNNLTKRLLMLSPITTLLSQVLVNLGLWGSLLQEQCALCHCHQESHYDKCFTCAITRSLLWLSFFIIIFFKCDAIINILVTNTCCPSCCNQSIATLTKAPRSNLTIASSYCIHLGPLHHNGTPLPCSN